MVKFHMGPLGWRASLVNRAQIVTITDLEGVTELPSGVRPPEGARTFVVTTAHPEGVFCNVAFSAW